MMEAIIVESWSIKSQWTFDCGAMVSCVVLFVSGGGECWYGPASLGRVGVEEGGGWAPGGQEQVTVVIVVRRAGHRQRLDQWQRSLKQSNIDYLSSRLSLRAM